MHDGKLEDTEKPPLLYHWATQSQALSAICITAQVVLSASVAHLVARWNTCEETWPSKGVDWGGLKWALSISLPTIMSYKVYFVCCQTRNVMSVLSGMSFNICIQLCLYLATGIWQTSLFYECMSTSTTLPTLFRLCILKNHHHSNNQRQQDHQCHAP